MLVRLTTIVLLSLCPATTSAQLAPGPTYDLGFEVYDTTPTAQLTFPPTSATSYPAFVYGFSTAAQRFFESVDAEGTTTFVSTWSVDGADLTFGTGHAADRLFLNEFGIPSGFPDGIYEVSPTGEISLFNDLGGGNPNPAVVVPPSTWGDVICISEPTSLASPPYNLSISLVDLAGNFMSTLMTLGSGPREMAAPTTESGPYGDYVYFNTISSSGVFRVDSSGSYSLFSSEPNLRQLKFGKGGSFGESLYASQDGERIVRIDPYGETQVVLTGVSSGRFDFEAATGDLYVYDADINAIRVYPLVEYSRGDCNQDGAVDIGDSVALLGSLFSGTPQPECADACDINDDGNIDVGDAVYLLSGLFSGGTAVPEPSSPCGSDPTSDVLGCESFTACP